MYIPCITISLPYIVLYYTVVVAERMMGAAMYELVRVGHHKLVCIKIGMYCEHNIDY